MRGFWEPLKTKGSKRKKTNQIRIQLAGDPEECIWGTSIGSRSILDFNLVRVQPDDGGVFVAG